ncbi:DUF5693 family protein [Gorillibacterium timonense]|uniref:DUF5693 family protein n=1 Tax=Gorillibacterium timonense TaxID=1689269 RepID=UPI000ACEB625|nr:DUF5693 family protein [Gorillibacterium timonense]
MKGYAKWNRLALKGLWILVALGLLASLPLAYARVKTERSTKNVEFVMDYRDLLEISAVKDDPQAFVSAQLEEMKKAGIRSVAMYETTLSELQLARRVDLFTEKDVSLLVGNLASPRENNTYLLFADEATRAKLQPELEYWFSRYKLTTSVWNYQGRPGMVINASPDEAALKPLGPDPIALEQLKQQGFRIVSRISNRHQPYVQEDMDKILSAYAQADARTLIVEGDYVPGYGEGDDSHIKDFAELMDKHHMGLASVELIKTPAGLGTLAAKLHYNVLRAHSFTEADADKLSPTLSTEQLDARIKTASDRFVLAVKDRNIRLIFLNARAYRNVDKATITDPLAPLYRTLQGKDGAIARIENEGFQTNNGPAGQFDYQESPLHSVLKPLVVAGAIALVTLLIAVFFPVSALPVFVLGLLGAGGLYLLSPVMLYKLLALAAGISSASLAMILAIKRLRKPKLPEAASGAVVNLFIRTTLLSLIGAVYVVGLLNHITFNLLLNQFTGVKALGFLPIVVVAFYLLLFSESLGSDEQIRKLKKILASPITVLWIVAAALLGGALLYYLSRTGNEGQVSGVEMIFRSFLENVLGVRPRTKEFLIGHPLFILGAYLWLRYRKPAGLWIFMFGVIGQVDMVGTFTHLHTPIYISAIRLGYGLLFGVVIGFILIGLWNLAARGWRKWAEPFIS